MFRESPPVVFQGSKEWGETLSLVITPLRLVYPTLAASDDNNIIAFRAAIELEKMGDDIPYQLIAAVETSAFVHELKELDASIARLRNAEVSDVTFDPLGGACQLLVRGLPISRRGLLEVIVDLVLPSVPDTPLTHEHGWKTRVNAHFVLDQSYLGLSTARSERLTASSL